MMKFVALSVLSVSALPLDEVAHMITPKQEDKAPEQAEPEPEMITPDEANIITQNVVEAPERGIITPQAEPYVIYSPVAHQTKGGLQIVGSALQEALAWLKVNGPKAVEALMKAAAWVKANAPEAWRAYKAKESDVYVATKDPAQKFLSWVTQKQNFELTMESFRLAYISLLALSLYVIKVFF